jgi:hypothetical protein
MVQTNDPNSPRGPGADRFTKMLRQKAPVPLESGKHMVYDHALRCLCKTCKSLLNWDCPIDISYTEAECCGLRYRLQPRTVIVRIEDVSSRPVLPKLEGSDYSDPEFAFDPDQLRGKSDVRTFVIPAAKFDMPASRPLVPKPPSAPKPTKKRKKRRCGICREPGHTRRKCPDR